MSQREIVLFLKLDSIGCLTILYVFVARSARRDGGRAPEIRAIIRDLHFVWVNDPRHLWGICRNYGRMGGWRP